MCLHRGRLRAAYGARRISGPRRQPDWLVITGGPGRRKHQHFRTICGTRYLAAEFGRLYHEEIATELIKNALGGTPDEQPSDSGTRNGAHNDDGAVALLRRL